MRTILLALTLGCTPTVPTPVPSTPVPVPAPVPTPTADCETVALDACADTVGCAVIEGSPLGEDASGACLPATPADSEVIGCHGADVSCPPVVAYGRATTESTVYEVPAGCLPDGWEPVAESFQACVVCEGIALGDCEGTSGCMLVSGRPSSATPPCLDLDTPAEPLACIDANGCGDAPTIATSPTGGAYVFTDTCTPPGWTVSGDFPDDCPADCASVTLTDCASTSGCMLLSGRPLQDDGASGLCEDPSVAMEPLACTEDAGCGDMITYATDSTTTWMFPDTCIPAGLTTVPGPFAACAP